VKFCRLADVATIDSGAGFPLEYQGMQGEVFPFLKVSDMNLPGNERTIRTWNHSISEVVRSKLRAKAFPVGALIFPKIGAAIGTNKKRQLSQPSCVDNNVMGVIPKPELLDSEFLYFQFLAKNISDFASDSNPPSIRKSEVESWTIKVPSLGEQRRIVDILSRADSIVRLRRDAEKKAAELIPALFLDMFGDPTTNPKAWPVKSLGELIIDGPQNGLYKHASLYGEGTPILRIDGFYDGLVVNLKTLKRVRITPEEQHRFRLQERDIVINRVNSVEYLGKSAIVPFRSEETVFESNMMRFSVNDEVLLPEYLIKLLQTAYAKAHILSNAKHAINQSSINQQDVKSLLVPVPPIKDQAEFAVRVEQISSIQFQQSAATTKAQATFDALLAQVF
jgi:type I restriction enzyme S subunit